MIHANALGNEGAAPDYSGQKQQYRSLNFIFHMITVHHPTTGKDNLQASISLRFPKMYDIL